jgi:hypothetical protein
MQYHFLAAQVLSRLKMSLLSEIKPVIKITFTGQYKGGTLGGFVTLGNGKVGAITCWHLTPIATVHLHLHSMFNPPTATNEPMEFVVGI